MILFMRLGAEQGRIIGSLIEKQLTTPQQYPLTLNALVLACNQVSNRDPVVSYQERLVDETLVSLKDAGLVRFVHPSHGRSVIRYRQVLDERLGLDNQELALVAVLLLRGAQTAGELRTRTERMAEFEGVGPVERDLERLSVLPEPLVARLGRRPGQKEDRWTQLLTDDPTSSDAAGAVSSASASGYVEAPATLADGSLPAGATPAGATMTGAPTAGATPAGGSMAGAPTAGAPTAGATPAGATTAGAPTAGATPAGAPAAAGSVSPDPRSLAAEVAALRAEVADLRAALEHLQDQLGGA
jgi:uncharacterized protein YceH (UPF0502 family)